MASNSIPSVVKFIIIPFAVSLIFFGAIKQLDGRFRNPYFQEQHTKKSAGVILRGIPIPFFLEKESVRTFTAEERKNIETTYKKQRYINNILENKHWYKNNALRSLLSTIAWIAFVIFALASWDAINRVFRTR
jgi:hypothetical protein